MIVVYLCAAARIILIASDFFKLHRKNILSRIIFFCGIILLAFCTLYTISTSNVAVVFGNRPIFSILMAALAVFFLLLLLYTLFYSLPIKKTYFVSEDLKLVDTGMYALCRHPGVIWLFLFYLTAWLCVDNPIMLWLGITNTLLDVLYVLIQDIYIFPQLIDRYDTYKKDAPFIIPNPKSIKRAIKTWNEDAHEKVTHNNEA